MESTIEIQEEKPFHTEIAQAIFNLSPDVLSRSAEEIARTIIRAIIEAQEAITTVKKTNVTLLQLNVTNRLVGIGQLRQTYNSYEALLESGLNIPALLIEKLKSCSENIFLRHLEIKIPKGMPLDGISTPKEIIINVLTSLIIEEFRTQIWPEEESEDIHPQALSGPEATPAPSVVPSILTRFKEMLRRVSTP